VQCVFFLEGLDKEKCVSSGRMGRGAVFNETQFGNVDPSQICVNAERLCSVCSADTERSENVGSGPEWLTSKAIDMFRPAQACGPDACLQGA
jgi:hypothetical protein